MTLHLTTTPGPTPPDQPQPSGIGVGMVASTVWIRVEDGGRSTPWTECRGVVSMHKIRALFDAVEDDAGLALVWERVTLAPWGVL